jgi:ABC-2 type transport system ATP-binding protein
MLDAMSDVPVLRCSGLTRRFGERTAVDDVTFAVAPGETYGLLGPNGAGKSTTIRMVCGLLHRDAGDVELSGHAVAVGDVGWRTAVGYVPQDVALYLDLTARENLRFFGSLYALRGRALDEQIAEVLHTIGLEDRADERVDSFSGGMRRRLNIGAGLVHQPKLLILDEPTVGVDPQSRHAILQTVDALSDGGTAVLYTTHYMEEAERICDRVGIIDRGRLIAEGTRQELVDLVEEQDRIELVAAGDLDAFAMACRSLDEVQGATVSDGAVHVLAHEGRRLLPRLLDLAESHRATVSSVEVVEPDLEAVFLHLTGTALRE